MLGRIIGGVCELLFTDHERLLICFTGNPYPVWIWTPDDVTNEEKEKAYEIVRENGLLAAGHSFNLKSMTARTQLNRMCKPTANYINMRWRIRSRSTAAHVLALNRERDQTQPFLPEYKDSGITVNLVRNHLSPYFLTNT